MNQQIPYGYNPNMMQPMYPNQNNFLDMNDNMLNNLQQRVNDLEQRLIKIEKRLNMNTSNINDLYQSSMHMM